MSVNERFKILRKSLKYTQVEFAKKLKLTQAAIVHYESGRTEISNRLLQIISKRYNINLNWLLTGEGEMYQEKPYLPDEGPKQRMYVEGEIAAGAPVETTGEQLDTFTIGQRLISNTNDYYCFRVNGHNMGPDIKHGDMVIIKKSYDWHENENKTCAVKIDDDITLKRVVHDHSKKMIVLVSDNKEYDPIIVNPKDTYVTLLGSLFMIIRKVG